MNTISDAKKASSIDESQDKRKNAHLRKYIKELEFNNNILQAQQELSLDGILVVDENWEMVSFNQRFIDMWQIPGHVLQCRDDKESIKTVLDKLTNPTAFLARVEHLMQNPDESSRDLLELLDGRLFDRYSAPIYDKKNNLRGRVWFFRDITEISQARTLLQEQNAQLEKMVAARTHLLEKSNSNLQIKEKELQSSNTSLRTLLHTIEEEKKHLHEKTTVNFRNGLLPFFDLLKKTQLSQKQKLILESLEHILDDMSSGLNITLQQCRHSLTPMEVRIANFITSGRTSKEIADILNSSERTIEGHRSSIRNKFGLSRGDNLRSHLQTIS